MAGYYSTQHWRDLRLRALRRDRFKCVVLGCGERATHVDHIKTRPRVTFATTLDVIDNLRSLCKRHDDQVKEIGSKRKSGGKTRALGCNADGSPLDPSHHWGKG